LKKKNFKFLVKRNAEKETNTLLLKLKVVEQFFKLKMNIKNHIFLSVSLLLYFFTNAPNFAQFTKK